MTTTTQLVSVNFNTANTTQNVTISAVDMSKTVVLMCGFLETGAAQSGRRMIAPELTSTTNVRLHRGVSGTTIPVTFIVIESDAWTVQRGATASAVDSTAAISAVTLAKSWVKTYTINSSTSNTSNNSGRGFFNSTTEIGIDINGADVTNTFWQVVSHVGASASVQTKTFDGDNVTSINSSAGDITAVNLAHSFLILEAKFASARQDRAFWTTEFASTTRVRVDRGGAVAGAEPMTVFVVEDPAFDVQSGSVTYSAGTTTAQSDTLSPTVTVAESFPILGVALGGTGRNPDATATDWDDATVDLTFDTNSIDFSARGDNEGQLDIPWFMVSAAPSNAAPVIDTPIANQTDDEGESVSLAVDASDADLDDLSYDDNGTLPPGVTVNSSTGVIVGALMAGSASGSPYSVSIEVSDGIDSVSDDFTWTVNVPAGTGGDPPVITPVANQTNIEGEVVDVTVVATETPEFSLSGEPPGVEIDPDTGVISGQIAPGAEVASPYTVTVTASVASGGGANSLWDGVAAQGTFFDDSAQITTGTKVTFDNPGFVTAVRFQRDTGVSDSTCTVSVWKQHGPNLGDEQLIGTKSQVVSGSGWKTITFDDPVPVLATNEGANEYGYMITVHRGADTKYTATSGYFTGSSVTSGDVTAPASASDVFAHRNGVFKVTNDASLPPDQHFGDASYFVDLVFTLSLAGTEDEDEFTWAVTEAAEFFWDGSALVPIRNQYFLDPGEDDPIVTPGLDEWACMPLRSPEERALGLPGSDQEQFTRGFDQSPVDWKTIFLAQDVGPILRSQNFGRTWEHRKANGKPQVANCALICHPTDIDTLFVLTDAHTNTTPGAYNTEGIYKSTDAGDTWVLKQVCHPDDDILPTKTSSPGAPARYKKQHFCYDPTTSGATRRWYCVADGDGLYRSNDDGETWSEVWPITTATLDNTFRILHHPGIAGTVYIAAWSGVWKSTNAHQTTPTFTRLSGGLPQKGAFWIEFADPVAGSDTLYASISKRYAADSDPGWGIYRTTDAGATWTMHSADTNLLTAWINPEFPTIWYKFTQAGAFPRLFRSTDSGANWTACTVEPPVGLDRDDPSFSWKQYVGGDWSWMLFNPTDDEDVVLQGNAQIMRSEPGGTNFVNSAYMYSGWHSGARQIFFDPENAQRILIPVFDVGIAHTTSGGLEWTKIATPSEAHFADKNTCLGVGVMPGFPNILLARVGDSDDGHTWKTENLGGVWLEVDSNAPKRGRVTRFHKTNARIMFSANRRNYYSGGEAGIPTQAGESAWSGIAGATGSANSEVFRYPWNFPDTVWAMESASTNNGRIIWKGSINTASGAVTWTAFRTATFDMRGGIPTMPAFCPSEFDQNIVYTRASNGDLCRWTGAAETRLNAIALAPGNNLCAVACDATDADVIYAAFNGQNPTVLVRTTDGGATWEDITGRLPRTYSIGISVSPYTGEVFWTGNAGLWVRHGPNTLALAQAGSYPVFSDHAVDLDSFDWEEMII